MNRDLLFSKTIELISDVMDYESRYSSFSNKELTNMQSNILKILYFSRPKNLSELSKCLNINLPNCSREVKNLVNKGYLLKKSTTDDKRVTEIHLSDKGVSFIENFITIIKKDFMTSISHLSDSDVEMSLDSIETLTKNIFKTR